MISVDQDVDDLASSQEAFRSGTVIFGAKLSLIARNLNPIIWSDRIKAFDRHNCLAIVAASLLAFELKCVR